MIKYDKIFICFVQVKFYSKSLTSVKIAKIKSDCKVTDCFDAGLFLTFLSLVCGT